MFCSFDERNSEESRRCVSPLDMVNSVRDFDEGVQNGFDSSTLDCDSKNVHNCHSSGEGDVMNTSEEASGLNLNIDASFVQIGRRNTTNFDSLDPSLATQNSGEGSHNDKLAPVLRELSKPRDERLNFSRRRNGFPDLREDHLVEILVCRNQDSTEALDIADKYDVSVSVSHVEPSESCLKIPDFQSERIKSENKSLANGNMIGVVGFLFRFHEPNTKYKITFFLHPIHSKRRGRKKNLWTTSVNETISEISLTLETGNMIPSRSGKTGKKVKAARIVPPSLELTAAPLSEERTVLYQRSLRVMKGLQSLRDNAKWDDFDKHANDLLLEFADADTQIGIKLEQSVVACYRNQLEISLQIIDDAFSMIDRAENQELLRSRGFSYKAGVKRRQRNLGEAERFVDLAEQNSQGCHAHLDTSFIVYERAGVLLEFIALTAFRSPQQVNEALRNLETCIDLCTKLENEDGKLYVKKHHFALIKMAMLLLDCRTEAARKRDVSKDAIAKSEQCLNTLKEKYWSVIAEGLKVQFNLVMSDLEYRKGNYTEAERYANLARDMAVEMGFNTEIDHAQERLNHIRALTCQEAISDGPVGGTSLFSDSEGCYGDVSSSSGYESDCLNSKDLKILE